MTLAVPSNSEKKDSDPGGDDGTGVDPDMAAAAGVDGPAALALRPWDAGLDMAAGGWAPSAGPHVQASCVKVGAGIERIVGVAAVV